MSKRVRMMSAILVGTCLLAASAFSAYAAEEQVDAAEEQVSMDITWEDMFGPQDGVLTVDESAGEWSLYFANPYGEHTVSGIFAEDGTTVPSEASHVVLFVPGICSITHLNTSGTGCRPVQTVCRKEEYWVMGN